MRTLALTVLLLVSGCSPTPSSDRPDVYVPAEADAPDALDPPDAAIACVLSESCFPTGDVCDGGFRYSCFGGSCPMGDVGSCRVLNVNTTTTRTGEACCERKACTREHGPLDFQCLENPDGGSPLDIAAAGVGWTCPPGVSPPGKCRVYGKPVPGPTQPTDNCCTP